MPSRRSSGEPGPAPERVRLQVLLARAGIASRRACEELIREGRVSVNGVRAELGSKVDPARDTVKVDGRSVSARTLEWVALHKPRGFVTTREDPSGRKTVYDLLPPNLHHLFHVGRLDRDSSGLLLLTNDGEAANRLLHPRYGTRKEYRVDVEGRPSRQTLEALVDGVPLDDGVAQAVSVEFKGEIDEGVFRLLLVLEEGRNREVRRLLEAVGHPVRRLFRRSFGPIEVGRLRTGEWRRLEPREVRALGGTAEVEQGDTRGQAGLGGKRQASDGRRAGGAAGREKGESRRAGGAAGREAGESRQAGRRPRPGERSRPDQETGPRRQTAREARSSGTREGSQGRPSRGEYRPDRADRGEPTNRRRRNTTEGPRPERGYRNPSDAGRSDRSPTREGSRSGRGDRPQRHSEPGGKGIGGGRSTRRPNAETGRTGRREDRGPRREDDGRGPARPNRSRPRPRPPEEE